MSTLPIILCFLLQAQPGSILRLYPVDDTARDPAFKSYAKKLRAAVDARNTEALRKLVDPTVIVGPAAGDKGWAKFIERWSPDDRERPAVWEALSDLLSLGFIREHPSLFLSPYVSWRFPADLNPSTHLVIVRDSVALRESPSASARSVAVLSFDVVQRLGPSEHGQQLGDWIPVRTLEGKVGYLNARDVKSPLMPRAQFGRVRGHWLLIALEGPAR